MSKGELSYKYQRLRERLRMAVKSGELSGKLPGERELARRYAANAKTINKALNDLAMEGLVLRHVGRGTFVADGTSAVSKRMLPSRCFAWLAPGEVGDPDLEHIFGMTRTFLADRGHHIERVFTELDGAGELPEATLSPRTMRQIDGAVIYSARPSRAFLINLRRRHLPMVLVNNHHDEIRQPTVLCDYAHAAFTLCEQCILTGHRKIQVVIRPESLPAASSAEMGYRAAMTLYRYPPLPSILGSPELDWSHALKGENRPTALICGCGKVAGRACELADEVGLNVPRDLSISVIGEPGENIPSCRQLSAYEIDASRMFRWAADLVLQGWSNQPPSVIIIPGTYVDRGSIVPPKHPVRPPSPFGEAVI